MTDDICRAHLGAAATVAEISSIEALLRSLETVNAAALFPKAALPGITATPFLVESLAGASDLNERSEQANGVARIHEAQPSETARQRSPSRVSEQCFDRTDLSHRSRPHQVCAADIVSHSPDHERIGQFAKSLLVSSCRFTKDRFAHGCDAGIIKLISSRQRGS